MYASCAKCKRTMTKRGTINAATQAQYISYNAKIDSSIFDASCAMEYIWRDICLSHIQSIISIEIWSIVSSSKLSSERGILFNFLPSTWIIKLCHHMRFSARYFLRKILSNLDKSLKYRYPRVRIDRDLPQHFEILMTWHLRKWIRA